MIKREDIIEAYLFLRENNQTIPDETLDFIKESSISALENDELMTIFRQYKDVELELQNKINSETKYFNEDLINLLNTVKLINKKLNKILFK